MPVYSISRRKEIFLERGGPTLPNYGICFTFRASFRDWDANKSAYSHRTHTYSHAHTDVHVHAENKTRDTESTEDRRSVRICQRTNRVYRRGPRPRNDFSFGPGFRPNEQLLWKIEVKGEREIQTKESGSWRRVHTAPFIVLNKQVKRKRIGGGGREWARARERGGGEEMSETKRNDRRHKSAHVKIFRKTEKETKKER